MFKPLNYSVEDPASYVETSVKPQSYEQRKSRAHQDQPVEEENKESQKIKSFFRTDTSIAENGVIIKPVYQADASYSRESMYSVAFKDPGEEELEDGPG